MIDTRPSSDGMGIRRRRTCVSCEYRFSTLEEAEILDLTIVKNDGRREAFSREKILKGIVRALEKRPARLRGFYKVAYIRFASVYRQFEDVQTFQTELNALLQKRQKRTG